MATSQDVQYDAILVLGGGVPLGPRVQLPFVANRCNLAKEIYTQQQPPPKILTLSAGTAHCPQLMCAAGLPVWEATVSAACLIDAGVPAKDVYVETTSYDTIGNAYYARMCHTEVANWRKLLIITSEFHMERTKAIFDWVFALDPPPEKYTLMYQATPDDGLTGEAVTLRAEREHKSAENVRNNLAANRKSLRDVHQFLTSKHDLYMAESLVERASKAAATTIDPVLAASYGGTSGN